ncbi:MAG: hypothetical protein HGA76_02735 [Candidatus Firestonebacteria bacterium]|nr:hypothetical protein [Candidatus Firestonebacteria bacterium]
MNILVNETHIIDLTGEMAKQHVDAYVHPTNNYLWFSSEVSESLKRIAGEYIETAATNAGPIEVGQAVIAPHGRLKCRYLIHTAAWGQDMMTSELKIRQAVTAALDLAAAQGCVSLAIPAVGANIGGFSMPNAVQATFLAILEHCQQRTSLREIRFLTADKIMENLVERLMQTALLAIPPEPGGSA